MKKKLLLIGLPLVLLIGAGTTVGLAFVGKIHVPFLPFKRKKPVAPPKDDGKGGPFAPFELASAGLVRRVETEFAQKKAAPTPPAPPIDPEPGERKLAALWVEMPTDRLAAVVAKWPEPQVGRILAKMDEEAVTNLLAALPPERAVSLSKAVAVATDESAAKVRSDREK